MMTSNNKYKEWKTGEHICVDRVVWESIWVPTIEGRICDWTQGQEDLEHNVRI